MTIRPSGYEEEPNHLYETERYGTEVLLRHFPNIEGMTVWECAAGNHKMADVLRERGALVVTSDIATYEREHDMMLNFLTASPADARDIDAIITNPPYGKGNHTARKFCERALACCPSWIAMLMPFSFDAGMTRTHLFRDNPRFHSKIALLDRLIWFPAKDGEKQTVGTGDHAWYVWAPKQELVAKTQGPALSSARMFWEGREA